ncbi:MAG: hypothetical protein WA705_03920 [Candidatus Ozemobacteraceae bacterium]
MKHLKWLFLAFLFVGSQLGAMPYVVGDCVVDVEIRNTAMIPILQKWVAVKERNGNILVFARGEGYVTKKIEITKADGQKYYKLDVVLEDEPRYIIVRDVCGTLIRSAYVDKSQFGFPSDVYGITIGIPKKLLPHPSPKMIQVMSDLVWVPILKSCKIEEIEGFQKITLTVDRGDYAATQRLISVVIAMPTGSTDEDEADGDSDEDTGDTGSDTPKIWLTRLLALESLESSRTETSDSACAAVESPEYLEAQNPSQVGIRVKQAKPGSSRALAELLVNAYPLPLLEAAMTTGKDQPETMKQLLAQKESFRVLHRD